MQQADEFLEAIRSDFVNNLGIQRKRPIKEVAEVLSNVTGSNNRVVLLGDDAAVIPDDDKYLLLAADGINLDAIQDLYWAGYCAVLVNVNDIYAMGGRPLAMVNVLGGTEPDIQEIIQGIKAGCQKFQVPMVGGHLHPGSLHREISVAILGETRSILISYGAESGDDLIIALDLKGRVYRNYLNWDCTSQKSSEEVIRKLEAVRSITEEGLVHAGKDISNPGILGTISMLLECSGMGAKIDLAKIPKASEVGLQDWLNMYPGFGFVFSVRPQYSGLVCQRLADVGATAAVVGKVLEEQQFFVSWGKYSTKLVDFHNQYITGFTKNLYQRFVQK